ncbi:MAG: Rieske (2Fe-2S) protein [Planctomycetaceae bacterium]
MAEYRAVCRVEELPPGKGRSFVVTGRELALFHVDGRFHALDNNCCHAGGPLGDGTLEGCVVTCPWHAWRYDVTTGLSVMSAQIKVERFETRVTGGQVEVLL